MLDRHHQHIGWRGAKPWLSVSCAAALVCRHVWPDQPWQYQHAPCLPVCTPTERVAGARLIDSRMRRCSPAGGVQACGLRYWREVERPPPAQFSLWILGGEYVVAGEGSPSTHRGVSVAPLQLPFGDDAGTLPAIGRDRLLPKPSTAARGALCPGGILQRWAAYADEEARRLGHGEKANFSPGGILNGESM